MTLYFGHSKNDCRCIAHPQNEKEIYQLINKFLEERNYKSYYIRSWSDSKGVTTLDVGSHTQFFFYKEETTNEVEDWNGKIY